MVRMLLVFINKYNITSIKGHHLNQICRLLEFLTLILIFKINFNFFVLINVLNGIYVYNLYFVYTYIYIYIYIYIYNML